MMTTLIELLGHLGRLVWEPLWIPTLAWTSLALPALMVLERTNQLHPLAEYRLTQTLLIALPIGIIASSVAPSLFLPEPVEALAATSGVNLPSPGGINPSTTGTESTAITSGEGPSWKWIQLVGLFSASFLLASLANLAKLAFDLVWTVRLRFSSALSPHESATRRAHRLAARLRVTRLVRVCTSPVVSVPATLGGLHPLILIPPSLEDQKDVLRTVLLHELVHVRRYDDLAHLVERFIAALFALHPLVGRLCSHSRSARERACDTAVLREASVSSAWYARLLTAFAQENSFRPLGSLSLAESRSSLIDRIAAMRSSAPDRLTASSPLGAAVVSLTLVLTVGMVACTDSVSPSSSPLQHSSSSPGGESTWTPFADARRAGGTWLEQLNNGKAAPTYDALISSEMLTKTRWTEWVRERRATLGKETQRILHHVDAHGLESERPSVVLNYGLAYASGAECGFSLEMVLVGSTWNVASLGTLSCSGFLPPGIGPDDETSASRIMIGGSPASEPTPSSGHLPAPVGGRTAVQEAIPNPKIAQMAQGIIVVEFIVEKDGQVTNVHVQNSIGEVISSHSTDQSPEDLLHSAALQAIQSTSFKPGRLDGQPVPTQMRFPVRFDCTMMRSAGLEQPCLPDE